jgi:DNA recombination protein RmuC
MGTFNKQWGLFVRSMEKMGKKLDEAQSEFQGLTATRRNQLEKPLREIEDLRQQRGLEPEPLLVEAETVAGNGTEGERGEDGS